MQGLHPEESAALSDCLAEYEQTFFLIEQYDRGRLEAAKKGGEHVFQTETATALIARLKQHLSNCGHDVAQFGKPNAGEIGAAISNIYQTAFGADAYPGAASKAANLFYLLVKNHYFVDGNKRIAALLFVWYLRVNGMLYAAPREPVVSRSLLYTLTIFIAESGPKHKDLIVDLVSKIVSPPTPENLK